jgi:hypothetical protein
MNEFGVKEYSNENEAEKAYNASSQSSKLKRRSRQNSFDYS